MKDWIYYAAVFARMADNWLVSAEEQADFMPQLELEEAKAKLEDALENVNKALEECNHATA